MSEEVGTVRVVPALPAVAERPTESTGPGLEPAVPMLSASAEARIVAALEQRHSPSTARNYRTDWDKFRSWCAERGHVPMPAHPHTVADYLTEHAELRAATGERRYATNTLTRWVASINYWHRACARPAPGQAQIVKDTLAGLRRTYAAAGERPTKRVAPLLGDEIGYILATMRQNADTWQDRLRERRDSAIILIGFLGAFRRAELSGLQLRDITLHPQDGLHILVRRSKTDQVGDGMVKATPFAIGHRACPPCVYRRWLDVVLAHHRGGRDAVAEFLGAPDTFRTHVCNVPYPDLRPEALTAPVFRPLRVNGNIGDSALTGQGIHGVIRRAAADAGLSPAKIAKLGGHSLRAGFVTQAFRNGAQAHEVMRQTGHKNPATLEIYAREHNPLTGNAVAGFEI
ncbi:tyrosine-type recombinase/integrase [Rhodococcus hoagii]|uniref:Tyrosine-type recombinase/integrase n=1 Tax=Rhodococcus hoagii TaxID=43767 RepID=A0AAE4ZG82_RHOHA|nr:tyrosine-type recombinase/integrase [Prescottella equi]NKV31965.1 tyrosine-type recombinase/integrase [Prescottella equi]